MSNASLSIENAIAFKDQVYSELKDQHDENNLFEDPEFPAANSSIYYSKSAPHGIKWLRPKEARNAPEFVVEGYDRSDMDQGQIGNCWFIAACNGIAQSPKLLAKVVPDQSLSNNYAGIFHFRFWLYGKWVDVVVDDRLPYTSDGRFLFCCNKQQPNEYWAPLLEKAYAKVYGSYEALDAGQIYDALIDMSGGVEESFNLKDLGILKPKFWEILLKSFDKNSILGCSINPDPSVREARMPNGLVRGHAYSITKVVEVGGNKLLRIRNPWGNEVEWTGAWSDSSHEWSSISESDKQNIGFKQEKDGEFWMSFSDFMRSWDCVQMCHLTLDSFSAELEHSEHDEHLMWKCKVYQSEWRAGLSAGGCGSTNQAKFWTNPQFLIKLTDVDEDDNENKATVVVALMQKDTRLRRARMMKDSAEEFIQFKLFKIKDGVQIDENQSTGLKLYGGQLDRIDASGSYINSREVTKRFRVDPGNYLIIPSTYEEDHNCEFMLRVFTETPIDAGSLDEDKDPDELSDDDKHFDIKKEDTTKAYWQDILNFICPIIFKGFKNSKNKTLNNIGEFLGPHFNNLANSDEAAELVSGFASGFSSGFGQGMGEGGLGRGLASGFKSGLSSAFKKFNF